MKPAVLCIWWGPIVLTAVALIMSGCNDNSGLTAPVMDRKFLESNEPVAPATGPLKVHPANPRYFADGSGKAIYLTGSHHWNNLVDSGEIGQPLRIFDYSLYLDVLRSYKHNFMRMWAWEGGTNRKYVDLFPYARTGPGTALDGKPKFDLEQFDQAYFNRLRSRVVAARERGIYASVMFFNGWNIYDHGYGNPWPLHPFNGANNINGIDGSPDGNGEGKAVHTLKVAAITERQQAYVRKVVDTVNDLDNVLYEITNETAIFSKDWQYYMIRFVQNYETTKPKQHPVGMTSFDTSPEEAARDGAIDVLLSSPADWISPCNDGKANYAASPPVASGKKVILSDTDHFFGVGGDHSWVWKTFTRGLNPIYMDPLDLVTGEKQDPPNVATARSAMADTRSFANKINLAAMLPQSELCSTTFCLANPGSEYIAYLPFGSHWVEAWIKFLPIRLQMWAKSLNLFHRTVTVDLTAVSRTFRVEWFDPVKSRNMTAGTATGGGRQKFTAPFAGDAVLYLTAT